MLDDEADVFVLEVDGDARVYPCDWMILPHIAGDSVGGEQVTMTYCALSNLPLAFSSSIEGEDDHLKVVLLVHNNLVMFDTLSGELYQQITNRNLASKGWMKIRGEHNLTRLTGKWQRVDSW